jgi:hypothetical protein
MERILLCQVAVAEDGGLSHTYPAFATADFYFAAKQFGFELQGNHILSRKNVIVDPKWKKAIHPRQNHCT